MTLQIRLVESHNSLQIRLAKIHNLTVPKTDLSMGSSIKPAHKLAKSLIKTSSKVHELKTYNKAIDNPIHGKRWHKAIDNKL